jgi:hypothetical protein
MLINYRKLGPGAMPHRNTKPEEMEQLQSFILGELSAQFGSVKKIPSNILVSVPFLAKII